MNNKYFVKLKNDYKVEVSKEAFDIWLHDTNSDYILVQTPNNNTLYIKKKDIVFGYDLCVEEYDVKKNFKGK